MRSWKSSDVQKCYCAASVRVQINTQDDFTASVSISRLKHYTAHIESDLSGYFVQHAGTFSELFMLTCVGIILILYFYCSAKSCFLSLCGPF